MINRELRLIEAVPGGGPEGRDLPLVRPELDDVGARPSRRFVDRRQRIGRLDRLGPLKPAGAEVEEAEARHGDTIRTVEIIPAPLGQQRIVAPRVPDAAITAGRSPCHVPLFVEKA